MSRTEPAGGAESLSQGAQRPGRVGTAAPGGSPGRSGTLTDMRQTDTERHLSRLEAELSARTAGLVTGAEIQRVLQQALHDLKGSVSRDSLPEMAARLAAARLDAHDRILVTA